MTFLYLIFSIVINIIGEPAHQITDKLNDMTGLGVHGVVYFFAGWLIALIIDGLFRG
jgi:hypothetical protein